MASQTNLVDVEFGDGDMSRLTPAEFYASAKHQAVRKLLGFSPEPSVLSPWTRVPNDNWQNLQGILSEFADQDTSDIKDAERAREREHDEQEFGPFPER